MQELLNVNFKNHSYKEEDYVVSDCNLQAYEKIQNFPLNWGVNPFPKFLWLKGDSSSGKTHLSKILENKIKKSAFLSKNIIITSNEIISNNIHLLIIDDADDWEEEKIFHQFNIAKENDIFLLILSNINWDIKLPDLKSRILSLDHVELKKPDDNMINILISLEFSKRSIKISHEIIEYLKYRLPRDYQNIRIIIGKIDNFLLQNKIKLNLNSIRKYFKVNDVSAKK